MSSQAEVSRRVRSILQEKGKSQLDVAKLAHLSTWTINAACKGMQSEATRTALANALGVAPDDLGPATLTGKKSKTNKGSVSAKSFELPKSPAVQTVDATQQSAQAKTSVASLIQDSVTEDEREKLAEAIFRARRSRGFSESEMATVESWAEKIKFEYAGLKEVLSANASLDIDLASSNPVRIVPNAVQIQRIPVAVIKPSSAPLETMIEAHLTWGKQTKSWKDYYVAEKRNVLKAWNAMADFKTIGDITLSKFQQGLQRLHNEKKSKQSIDKFAKTIEAFCAWAAEKGMIPANLLAGASSAVNIRQIIKSA